jgi:hypothetical protein
MRTGGFTGVAAACRLESLYAAGVIASRNGNASAVPNPRSTVLRLSSGLIDESCRSMARHRLHE